MSRQSEFQLPTVIGKQIVVAEQAIAIESPEWYAWLRAIDTQSFRWQTSRGSLTVRRELKRQRPYWYAYHKRQGKLMKTYLGKSEDLSLAKLEAAVQDLILGQEQRAPRLELRFLGYPEILRNDQPIAGLTNKAITFLAYLAERGTAQRRDHLLALFWPDSSTSAAQKNLRNLLWTIKSTLGLELIEVQGDKLSISSNLFSPGSDQFSDLALYMHTCSEGRSPIDLGVESNIPLETLEERARLYRGRFLEGIAFEHEVDLDLWLTIQREQFHQYFVCGVHQLIGVYRKHQQWHKMIHIAQRAVEQEPCEEALYVTQMEAWARMGNRSSALRVYDLLRSVLLREQGIEPLENTIKLRNSIASGQLGPQLSSLVVQQRSLSLADF